LNFPTDEMNPECNIDHGSLVADEKSTPTKELIEYIIQFRNEDLENLNTKPSFDIDINEHELLSAILMETKDDFRNIIRDAVTMSYIMLTYDRSDLYRITTKLKILRNKIKINIHIPTNVNINELSAADFEGELVTFDAQISNWSKFRTITFIAQYKCPECQRVFTRTYNPKIKHMCEEDTKVPLEYFRAEKSEDTRRLTLRQITDDFSKKMPFSISADVYGKTVWEIELGDKVIVTGIFRSVPLSKEHGKISQEFIPTIQVISIQNKSEDVTIMPSMELMKKFKDLEDKNELVKSVIDGFSYNIYKKRMEKKAILCALIGSKWIGQVGKGNPPMIHILFVGDPQTYKSTMMKHITDVSDGCVSADATTVSNAGIKAIAVKMDDGRWSIMPGLLPLYNHGLVFLDEFADLKEDIYADLKAPMIDGIVSKHVAGEDFNGTAETGILASMNPIDGVYDDSKTIYDNLERLGKPLITRFDIIFKFSIEFNKMYEDQIAEHFDKYDAEGKPKGILTDKEIKLFINYVKTIDPKITKEALRRNTDFFRNINKKSKYAHVETRTKNAIMKFSVAIAKWHMCTEVTVKHVDEALELYKAGLETFGMHFEDGEFIDEVSLKKTVDGKRQAIQKSYDALKDKDGYVFPDDLIEKALTYGCFRDEGEIKTILESLRVQVKLTEKNKMYHINWK